MGAGGPLCAAVLVVSIAAPARAAESGHRPTLAIQVQNVAGLETARADDARDEVTRALRAAGVDVEWTWGTPPAAAPALQIVLANGKAPTGSAIDADLALGYAVSDAGRAYVFVDRILAHTRTTHANPNVVLAQVMTHEIGHLLLGPGGHSEIGVMRPHFDASFFGYSRFTREQSAAIRARLAR